VSKFVSGADSLAAMEARRRDRYPRLLAVAAVLLAVPAPCRATDVRIVAITPGRREDVVIDHREALTIEEGQTIEGVRVVRVEARGAVLTVDGVTKMVALGAAGSEGPATSGASVTLTADRRGHYATPGSINGKPVKFLVDTGATLVALSRAEATRIGIDFQRGRPTYSMTANGPVRGWSVTFATVRVGAVEVRDVPGAVIDSELAETLLGMSFLNRFDLLQQGATLVLRRRAR
jgi:aspartyl protease family protein